MDKAQIHFKPYENMGHCIISIYLDNDYIYLFTEGFLSTYFPMIDPDLWLRIDVDEVIFDFCLDKKKIFMITKMYFQIVLSYSDF